MVAAAPVLLATLTQACVSLASHWVTAAREVLVIYAALF